MISWKPLTLVKLQFSLLWICPQPLILWTTLHFFTDFSTLSVNLVMLSLGFAHIQPTAHPLWKSIRLPHLPPPYSLACLRALFSVHCFYVLFISPVANVINSDQSNQNNTVSFHQYADDTQLYIGTNSSTLTSQIASIESCTQIS